MAPRRQAQSAARRRNDDRAKVRAGRVRDASPGSPSTRRDHRRYGERSLRDVRRRPRLRAAITSATAPAAADPIRQPYWLARADSSCRGSSDSMRYASIDVVRRARTPRRSPRAGRGGLAVDPRPPGPVATSAGADDEQPRDALARIPITGAARRRRPTPRPFEVVDEDGKETS
jgi:hypothetical protein